MATANGTKPQSDTATERDTNKGYSFHAPGENKKK